MDCRVKQIRGLRPQAMGADWGRLGSRLVRCRSASVATGAWLLVLFASLAAPPLVAGQGSAASPLARYQFQAVHDPDGIGKIYLGREIAQVMGHQGADWLERPEREAEENTDELVNQLHLQRGEVVADIGAGTGYLSRRLARKVGPSGKVLAVDIQPEMLALLTNKMAVAGIRNVFPILGTISNPNLPTNSVDLAVMVDVYHEFEFPYEMMLGICSGLKPGGRVVFVEFRGEDPAVPIKPLHKMREAQVRKEMSVLPLKWLGTVEVLPRQHIITFAKRLRE